MFTAVGGRVVGADGADLGPAEVCEAAHDESEAAWTAATGWAAGGEDGAGEGGDPASEDEGATGNRDNGILPPEVQDELRSLPDNILLARDGFVFLGTPAPAPPLVGPGPQAPAPTIGVYDGRMQDRNVVPHGPLHFQQRIALRLVRQHDSRCHAVIRYVRQTTWKDQRVSRIRLQTALHMVRFSCNARDVHLLRGLDKEAVLRAAEYHDRQVMATVAAITGFLEVQDDERLGDVAIGRFRTEFLRGWRQACMAFEPGGLNFREWARYADAAMLGKWALVIKSARDTVTGENHFPIVARELNVAVNGGVTMPDEWADCAQGTTRAAWSLNTAWHRMLNLARNTHDTLKPPLWLTNTAADMARIEKADDRAQRAFSKTVTLSLLREYKEGIRGEPVANFVLKCAAAAGPSGWTAQPWQEEGGLTLHDTDVLINFCLRLGLPLPRQWQGRDTGALITNRLGWGVLSHPDSARKWWDLCHNAVQRVICDMISSAGGSTRMEDRTWDTADLGDEGAGTRRRPDIVAILADGSEIVVDVTGCWRHLTTGRDAYREEGAGAKTKEREKTTRYMAGMVRRHQQLAAEGVGVQAWVRDSLEDFYAAGFECTGGLGPRFKALVKRIETTAQINTVGADLYHWSAMSFRNHWRAAVGVAIMKHTARCLRGAGMSAVRKRGVDDPRPHDGLDSI
jgi:hypothetical protein